MKCAICGIEIETIDEAIEQDWAPSFYEGDKEYGLACSSCCDVMLIIGQDGEFELKPEYHGKIQFVSGDYTIVQEESNNVVIGIIKINANDEKMH